VKRALDLTIILLLCPLWIPILLVVALAVFTFLGRPILFRQERIGLRGRTFTLFKFRTMRNLRDRGGALADDAVRLTKFGKLLRAASLDELPEIWNVIKGDMSLVGPRPLLVEYLRLYNEKQMKRHDVLPGLTGWAQINGRNAITWEEKFELDVWYAENLSLALDTKILFATIGQVLLRRGINAEGASTMPRFTGSSSNSVPNVSP
jgi:sugar transferase EpsL